MMRFLHRRLAPALAAFVAAMIQMPRPAHAQARNPAPVRDSLRSRLIDTVRVVGRIDDLIGTAATASEGRVGAGDLKLRPITREGELSWRPCRA